MGSRVAVETPATCAEISCGAGLIATSTVECQSDPCALDECCELETLLNLEQTLTISGLDPAALDLSDSSTKSQLSSAIADMLGVSAAQVEVLSVEGAPRRLSSGTASQINYRVFVDSEAAVAEVSGKMADVATTTITTAGPLLETLQ